MYHTDQILGVLSLQLEDKGRSISIITESAIPLVEGGLVYKGVISPIDDSRAPEIVTHVSPDVLASARSIRQSDTEYEVTIGPADQRERYFVTLRVAPGNPKQFFGLVKKEATGQTVKFVYNDINEPITAGGVIIVLVGIAAILCALSFIIGLIANWNCDKVEVRFGFTAGKNETGMGCLVRCLEGADAGNEETASASSSSDTAELSASSAVHTASKSSSGGVAASFKSFTVHNDGDGEMYGGRNRVDAPVMGEQNRASFVWHNNTSKAIHDLKIDTNMTDGNDPDMNSVTVYKLGEDGERDGDPIADEIGINDTDAHIRFSEGIPPCSSFEVIIGLDGPFEIDESIEFVPTGKEGMPIN